MQFLKVSGRFKYDQQRLWYDQRQKYNLRYTDMIDITNGTFAALGIQPAANLNGSAPIRAGTATVKKLGEMALLNAKGNMIWPALLA